MKKPTEKEFCNALFNAYEEIKQKYWDTSRMRIFYVPIPELRKIVCKKLRINRAKFEDILVNLQRETDEYIISFGSPMLRAPGVIKYHNHYYYYLCIHYKTKET